MITLYLSSSANIEKLVTYLKDSGSFIEQNDGAREVIYVKNPSAHVVWNSDILTIFEKAGFSYDEIKESLLDWSICF